MSACAASKHRNSSTLYSRTALRTHSIMADTTKKPKVALADKYKVPAELLTDGEITLRRWHITDADALHAAAAASLPELQRWMPWAAHGYTLADAVTFINSTTGDWEHGEDYTFALIVDGEIVGSVGLMRPVVGDMGMATGYWIKTVVTGRGLATKATALLTKTAFALGAEAMQIWHHVDNEKSRAIPARLGFRCLGEWDDLEIGSGGMHGVWQMDRPDE